MDSILPVVDSPCEDAEFDCREGGIYRCIPMHDKCDGLLDCLNGRDELAVHCGEWLWKHRNPNKVLIEMEVIIIIEFYRQSLKTRLALLYSYIIHISFCLRAFSKEPRTRF